MDVLISLFSDEEMRLKRHVLLETQKVRKSGVRPCATLGIDPRFGKKLWTSASWDSIQGHNGG